MGFGSFVYHYLNAMVAGLGDGVLLATADDLTIDRDVVEPVLAGIGE